MPKSMHNFRPTLGLLEDRTIPYALSGYKWALLSTSASYVPDGTVLKGGAASSLFSMLDARRPLFHCRMAGHHYAPSYVLMFYSVGVGTFARSPS
jgi:hypothetical protein